MRNVSHRTHVGGRKVLGHFVENIDKLEMHFLRFPTLLALFGGIKETDILK